jgi:hypothetical protein
MYQLDKSHKTGYLIEKLVLSLAQINIRKMTAVEIKATRKGTNKGPLIDVGSFGHLTNESIIDEAEKIPI